MVGRGWLGASIASNVGARNTDTPSIDNLREHHGGGVTFHRRGETGGGMQITTVSWVRRQNSGARGVDAHTTDLKSSRDGCFVAHQELLRV
jgi:hypothetical protein